MYDYKARVLEVHDGDTIKVDIDLGFHLHFKTDLRLEYINAPELGTLKAPSPEGEASTQALMEMLAGTGDAGRLFDDIRTRAPFGRLGSYVVRPEVNLTIYIQTALSDQFEKYGRVLGRIWTDLASANSGPSINARMLDGGWAQPFM